MKLRLAVFVTVVSFVGGGCKQEPTPHASSVPSPPPTESHLIRHPLLWAVDRDGNTTYLLGTMHAGIDAATRLPGLVFDKLAAAQTFAMETDVDAAAISAAMRRSSGTLHDELGPAYWKRLEDVLSPAEASAIDGMKPMVAATLLSMRGLPRTPPMDQVLRDRATGQGKPIVYLETLADELASLERQLNAKAVKMMLDDPARGLAVTEQMLAAYLEGDETELDRLMAVQRADALAHGYTAAEYDGFVEDLLDRRNAAWIPAIERLHAAGGGFVAVGAMHLIGKRSVRELLARDGYRVTRVVPPPADRGPDVDTALRSSRW